MGPQPVRRVAVIGTGMMGPGIAYCFAVAGRQVLQVGRSEASLARARASIEAMVSTLRREGVLSDVQASRALNGVTGTTDLASAIAGADLVVESIVEDLAAKQAMFVELDAICPESTTISSNTSGLPITKISSGMRHPERAATTHFWNPPHLVPLVEIVKGERTSEETAERLRSVLTEIGKRPVVLRKDVPGQLGPRLLHAITREALAIVQEGIATAEEVDTAVKAGLGLRFPVYGPLEHADMVGLDLTSAVASYLWRDLSAASEPNRLLQEKLSKGELGVKSGKGLYDWTARDPEELRAKRDAFLIARLKDLYPPRTQES